MRSDTETTTILDTAEGQAMSRILGSDAFYDANPHSYAGLVQRLQMLREGGLPPMRVVSAAEIERLGRIPRSTDTDAKVEDALDVVQRCGQDAAGKPLATLTFFSHQWLRPNWCEAKAADLAWGSPERAQAVEEGLVVGDVDSADHEKARALVQWAKWLKWATLNPDDSGTLGARRRRHVEPGAPAWRRYCSTVAERHETRNKKSGPADDARRAPPAGPLSRF